MGLQAAAGTSGFTAFFALNGFRLGVHLGMGGGERRRAIRDVPYRRVDSSKASPDETSLVPSTPRQTPEALFAGAVRPVSGPPSVYKPNHAGSGSAMLIQSVARRGELLDVSA